MRNLHELPAHEALKYVCNFDDFDPNEPELEYFYAFIKLQMA